MTMNIYRDLKQLPTFQNSVITIGAFDGLHLAHQKILKRVTDLAHEVEGPSVLITFYPHPRKVVDPSSSDLQILDTLEEKIDRLSELGIQNLVIIPFSFDFSRMAPREYIENFIIKLFSPAYIVIGYDHRFGLNRGGDINLLQEYSVTNDFEVIEILKQEIEEVGVSSTRIRKALQQGDIEEAKKFLGAPYMLSGKVVHGDKLGSKLGYPTANINISDKDKLIPCEGIYAVQIEIDQVHFKGMLYIGKRPTIGKNLPPVVEVNIFDFDQNIYDQYIKISLISYIRGDMTLDGFDALKEQMQLDKALVNQYFDATKKLFRYTQTPSKISVVILNYNGVDMLESYLPMVEYSSSIHEHNIAVIDNNSADESISYLEEWHPEIRIIPLVKNYGFAEGYNRGLQSIDSEYIAILNSDVLVTENWIDPIIKLMDNDRTIGIAQPIILSLEHKDQYEYAGAAGGYLDSLGYPFCRGRIFDHVEKQGETYANTTDIFWASGAAMVIRTELYKSLGGFDKMFFAHQEEIDLCWRAKRAGHRVVCVTDSKVYHLGGGTLDYQNSKKIYYNFRNNLYMLTKNEPFGKLLWLIPSKLLLDGIAGVKFIAERKYTHAFQILKAHFTFYLTLPLVIEATNRDTLAISKSSIGPADHNGKYSGSIVWQFFVRGKKTFDQLKF
jgi:riboflavin kinase/FMN adenylyltransferase